MAKSKKKVSDKVLGIVLGIALTISAIGIISAVSVSSAHTNPSSIADDNMQGMMGDQNGMTSDGNMMRMMHSMMNGQGGMMGNSTDMMNCMSMMKNNEMTQEEIDEMLKSMDKDGDGRCDMCGMSIEMCRKMMSPY